MKKRGPKLKGKVKIEWSSDFAYAIGLLVTDGCVYSDGRHISFVSSDLEQVHNFMRCLQIENKIGKNFAGYIAKGRKNKTFTHRVQFGDVQFVRFLLDIGIMPAKSKIIKKVCIPSKYFFDYLRGCFDGDGSIYSYWDPRWKSSFMFYVSFVSASKIHIDWLRTQIFRRTKAKGDITVDSKGSTHQLRYAKKESLSILKRMFYSKDVTCLTRKKLKIMKILAIVGESL
jgi:hypothetical protein